MCRLSLALANRRYPLLIAIALSAAALVAGCGRSDPVLGPTTDIPVIDTAGDAGTGLLDGGSDAPADADDAVSDLPDDPRVDRQDDPVADNGRDAQSDLPPDDADTGSPPCDGRCDPNATCDTSGSEDRCVCNPGYEGDGESCTPIPPPFVVVEPESIEFGSVALFATALETLTISNVGRAPRTIFEVQLRSRPSSGFAVITTDTFPTTLEAGESLSVQVRFRPTVQIGPGIPTPYSNTVRVESDDPLEPNIDVSLSGTGVDIALYCLTFDPDGLDFGAVAPGDTESDTLELSNCGSEILSLDALELDGPEALDFAFDVSLPFEMAPTSTATVTVTYAPTDVAAVRGVLEATSDDGAIAVALIEGGVGCPVAVATVEPRTSNRENDYTWGREGDTFRFDGSDSDDPAGGSLTYDWQIDAPDGSSDLSIDPDLESVAFSMVPDVPGRFVAQLRVTSDESGLESCNVGRAVADAFPLDPQVVVTATWENGADLDLHLVEVDPDGSFSDFGSQFDVNPKDAYWNNVFAQIGDPDDPVDNALYLFDDTDGFGPETVEIGRLNADSRYRIGLLYARRNQTQSVSATVEIAIGDDTPVTYSAEWSDTVFWVPAIIEGDGDITEVDEFLR